MPSPAGQRRRRDPGPGAERRGRATGGGGQKGGPAPGSGRGTCPTPCAHGMAAASRGSCRAPTPTARPTGPLRGTALPAAAARGGRRAGTPLPRLRGMSSSRRCGREETSAPPCSRGSRQQWGHSGTPRQPRCQAVLTLPTHPVRGRGARLGSLPLPWGSDPQRPLEGVRKRLKNSARHPPVPQREGTPLWQPPTPLQEFA